MDYERKTRVIANSCYNLGLEQAGLRDLSGAAGYLKKSLHFNKYMTDARNLLGLIYYEMGEVGEALVQWVISMNLQPEQNRADYYLGELKRRKGAMETEKRLVSRFNQALVYAQNGSLDLAVLQLNKVVEGKPNFVKAQLLLALLCMVREDYKKAGKAVYKVLQVDRSNSKALRYRTLLKGEEAKEKREKDPERERRRLKNVLSHRQMQDDDVILPPSYRESTRDQAVWYILAGLLIGAFVIFFLVMPASQKAINAGHNREMLKYSEELSKANQKAAGLEEELAALEEEKGKSEAQLLSLTTDSGSVLAQYQGVIGILQAFQKADFATGAKIFTGLNSELITSPDVLAVVAEIHSQMVQQGVPVLESLGDKAQEGGDSQAALSYYLKCVELKQDSWQAKYKAALIYKEMGEKEAAGSLFTDIVNNSKDEALSARAKAERGF